MFASRILLTLIALTLLTAIGAAHSGHGDSQDGNSLLHYVTSPMHLLPVLVAAILLAGLTMLVRRSKLVRRSNQLSRSTGCYRSFKSKNRT